MRQYMVTVTWVTNVSAETPEQAARIALSIQRNPQSIIPLFEVQGLDQHTFNLIDLNNEE